MRFVVLMAVIIGMVVGGKAMAGNEEIATFGAGCFWCVEAELKAIDGVLDVESGYMGGRVANPTYEQVSSKTTGHVEVVQVRFNPAILPYEKLVEAFWLIHDPTDAGGQGADRGPQYRSAIFYHDEVQQQIAEQSKQAADASGEFKNPIATTIEAAGPFYPAEGYHQDYYEKKGVVYDSVFDLDGESMTIKKYKKWGIME